MKALMVFAAFLLVACPPVQEPDVPKPTPTPPDENAMGAMCDHLRELQCEEGKDVYNDNLPGPVDVPNQSCEDFYTELEGQGIPINPQCIAKVPDCSAIEDYRARDPGDC